MVKNIKTLFEDLNEKNQHNAVNAVVELCRKSYRHIKERWLKDGKIPEKEQPKVLEIMQKATRQQIKDSTNKIEVIDPKIIGND